MGNWSTRFLFTVAAGVVAGVFITHYEHWRFPDDSPPQPAPATATETNLLIENENSSSSHQGKETLVIQNSGAGPYVIVDTPTKNISCEIHELYAACSIAERYYANNGATDCPSRLFSIKVAGGHPQIVCGEEFLGRNGDHVHEMEYGETVNPPFDSNYACKAEETGVSCWNTTTGHGFKLSRQQLEYISTKG